MMKKVLDDPSILYSAKSQSNKASFFPQRKPEDGWADWNLTQKEIFAHSRSLSRPYPGLRSEDKDGNQLIIQKCQPFDDEVYSSPGTIDFIFEDKSFLISCSNGRVIILDYLLSSDNFNFYCGAKLKSVNFKRILKNIIKSHEDRFPTKPINKRILNRLSSYE